MNQSQKKILRVIGRTLKEYIKKYTPTRVLYGILNFVLHIIRNILIMVIVIYGVQYLGYLILVKQVIPIEGIKRLADMPAKDIDAFFLTSIEKIINWITPHRITNIFFPTVILIFRYKINFNIFSYCLKQRTLKTSLILTAYIALIFLYANAVLNNYLDGSSLYVWIYWILTGCMFYFPEQFSEAKFRKLIGIKENT
jgi:hypothetical protein